MFEKIRGFFGSGKSEAKKTPERVDQRSAEKRTETGSVRAAIDSGRRSIGDRVRGFMDSILPRAAKATTLAAGAALAFGVAGCDPSPTSSSTDSTSSAPHVAMVAPSNSASASTSASAEADSAPGDSSGVENVDTTVTEYRLNVGSDGFKNYVRQFKGEHGGKSVFQKGLEELAANTKITLTPEQLTALNNRDSHEGREARLAIMNQLRLAAGNDTAFRAEYPYVVKFFSDMAIPDKSDTNGHSAMWADFSKKIVEGSDFKGSYREAELFFKAVEGVSTVTIDPNTDSVGLDREHHPDKAAEFDKAVARIDGAFGEAHATADVLKAAAKSIEHDMLPKYRDPKNKKGAIPLVDAFIERAVAQAQILAGADKNFPNVTRDWLKRVIETAMLPSQSPVKNPIPTLLNALSNMRKQPGAGAKSSTNTAPQTGEANDGDDPFGGIDAVPLQRLIDLGRQGSVGPTAPVTPVTPEAPKPTPTTAPAAPAKTGCRIPREDTLEPFYKAPRGFETGMPAKAFASAAPVNTVQPTSAPQPQEVKGTEKPYSFRPFQKPQLTAVEMDTQRRMTDIAKEVVANSADQNAAEVAKMAEVQAAKKAAFEKAAREKAEREAAERKAALVAKLQAMRQADLERGAARAHTTPSAADQARSERRRGLLRFSQMISQTTVPTTVAGAEVTRSTI